MLCACGAAIVGGMEFLFQAFSRLLGLFLFYLGFSLGMHDTGRGYTLLQLASVLGFFAAGGWLIFHPRPPKKLS
jgi:hypothetical protein